MHKLLTKLGEIRTVIIEITSTLSIALICINILLDKLKRR